jgi:hypothetical protein
LVLFFLKKEPKTLALRGFNSLTVCCGHKEQGFSSFGRIVLFKKRTKNISPAGLQRVEVELFKKSQKR